MHTTEANKAKIISNLTRFVSQRSGIDYRNYSDRENFMSDYRPIIANGRLAKRLIAYVDRSDYITAQDLVRLSKGQRLEVSYCTGQYFPTEYWPAVIRFLLQVIWQVCLAEKLNAGKSTEGHRKEMESLAVYICASRSILKFL